MPSPNRPSFALFVLLTAVAGCKASHATSSPPPGPRAADGSFSPVPSASPGGAERSAAQAPDGDAFELDDGVGRRQGLGTEYGEQKLSSIVVQPFVRGHSAPDVVLSIFYDDFAGVREMGQRQGGTEASSRITTPDGVLALTIVDEHGRIIPAADFGPKRYAIGEAGRRYRIGVENGSGQRFEVVASVDGLDVMDGGEAAFHKRGYIVEPFSSVMIDGWRTSHQTVAAFRFSDARDSYADRTGRPRNIGVIGVAFFHEQGDAPWDDFARQRNVNPFPGRFAPPPPPRRVVL
jgi:hypothetical protein